MNGYPEKMPGTIMKVQASSPSLGTEMKSWNAQYLSTVFPMQAVYLEVFHKIITSPHPADLLYLTGWKHTW